MEGGENGAIKIPRQSKRDNTAQISIHVYTMHKSYMRANVRITYIIYISMCLFLQSNFSNNW